MTVHSNCFQTWVNTLCRHSRSTCTPCTRLLEKFRGWGWMNRGLFIFQTHCITNHYSSCLKRMRLTFGITNWKKNTVLQRPLWTIQRKFQLQSIRKVKSAVGHTRLPETMTINPNFLGIQWHQAARARKVSCPECKWWKVGFLYCGTVIVWNSYDHFLSNHIV